MAFSFSGTFTSGQWEAFKAFTRIQAIDLNLRRTCLQKDLGRVGIFSTEYDNDGRPVSFSALAGSYAAKLLDAYRILGGVPEKDMLLRTSDQPVFLTRGTSMLTVPEEGTVDGGYSDVFSNSRRYRGGQRFDRDLGLKVEKVKSWQLEAVKRKREHLEFKIKRALDHSDQIQREIAKIDKLLADGSGNVDDQILGVELVMSTPGAANVVDDVDDVFGLAIGRVADMTYDDAARVAQAERQRGGQ